LIAIAHLLSQDAFIVKALLAHYVSRLS
jgi:hypothetical protein